MLAGKMTRHSDVCGLVLPRQGKRILREFIRVGDVERGGQRRFLADLIGSKYLGDFQYLGVIGLQIGERDRTVGCAKVDAKTETFAHQLKISVCMGCQSILLRKSAYATPPVRRPRASGDP